MDKIYYATTNQGKVASMQRYVGGLSEIVQVPIDIPEPRSSDVKEIAKAKVDYAWEHLKNEKCPVIALDAGFSLDAWPGFPGAYVNSTLETLGLPGLLKLVDGVDRGCAFVDCLAYKFRDKTHYFQSAVAGSLAEGPRGEKQSWNWSELSCIYMPGDLDVTQSQMTEEQWKAWSLSINRESSSKLFAEWLAIVQKT